MALFHAVSRAKTICGIEYQYSILKCNLKLSFKPVNYNYLSASHRQNLKYITGHMSNVIWKKN